VHLSLKIWPMVATILITFPKMVTEWHRHMAERQL